MPKQTITDTFETLGKVAQSVGQQAVSDVKKMGEEVVVELGIKPSAQGGTDDNQKQDQAKEEEIKKMAAVSKQKSSARYKQIREEIRQMEQKRERQTPQPVSGKLGFDEGKAVKQLETGKPAEDKKKLPPLPAQRASKKAEVFRGASG